MLSAMRVEQKVSSEHKARDLKLVLRVQRRLLEAMTQ